jgi:hypothetical protein
MSATERAALPTLHGSRASSVTDAGRGAGHAEAAGRQPGRLSITGPSPGGGHGIDGTVADLSPGGTSARLGALSPL